MPPEPPRRLVAVEVAGVRGAAVDRGSPVAEVVGIDRRAVDQRGAVAGRRVRHRAGQPVADVVVAVLDVGVGAILLGQLALVVVGIDRHAAVCCRAALRDALTLTVEAQAVVVLGDQAAAAVAVRNVGQAVQRIVKVSCRAEHRVC